MLPSPSQLRLPTGVQRLVAAAAVSMESIGDVANGNFYFGYWYNHWRA